MGKKSKAKTKQKKKAKKALKKKGKPSKLKNATKAVNKAEKSGLDVGELIASGLEGVPIVGGLLGEGARQLGAGAGGQVSSGRGGTRGVQLVDSTLGNLGTISRKKALSILVNRGRRPPRRRGKTVAILRAGESAQVVG